MNNKENDTDDVPDIDAALDEFVDDDEPPPPEESDSPVESSPPAKGSRLPLIVLFVLLLALAGGAYYWQHTVYQADLAELRANVDEIAAGQATFGSDIGNANAAAAAVQTTVDDLAGRVDEVAGLRDEVDQAVSAQTALQRSVSALYEKETQTSVDWVLAEAEYLVLAATQRLALESDVVAAIAALRAADQRLRSAEHPDLIPIREQLIHDVAALEAVSLPDVEGTAIYLAKAIGQVDNLPTKPLAEEVTPFSTVRSGEFEAQDWRRLIYAMWSDLTELVDVKDTDLPDSVLFDPELRYFLRQNLKLELASARLALLRRDRGNLDASTEIIGQLLEAYYDVSDTSVANIQKRLDEVKALNLSPQMPDITGSLDVIRTHRASRAPSSGPAS